MSNAPSKPVSFSRPKVGYFSNRPRISAIICSHYQGASLSTERDTQHQHVTFSIVNYKLLIANTSLQHLRIFCSFKVMFKLLQGAAFNVTHFESRITHLLYTAINTSEHGQVSQCLGFTKSLTSSIQRLGRCPP